MPMYVMNDIHIETEDGLSAQIDYIVVTRKVTFLIECKNLIGNIDIDSEGNFNRNYELYGKHIKEKENSNDELIKNLKAFRLQRSREENIKPYFVFNDKQMMDLISKNPHSKDELQEVSGFGKLKAEKYGDGILKILKENK